MIGPRLRLGVFDATSSTTLHHQLSISRTLDEGNSPAIIPRQSRTLCQLAFNISSRKRWVRARIVHIFIRKYPSKSRNPSRLEKNTLTRWKRKNPTIYHVELSGSSNYICIVDAKASWLIRFLYFDTVQITLPANTEKRYYYFIRKNTISKLRSELRLSEFTYLLSRQLLKIPGWFIKSSWVSHHLISPLHTTYIPALSHIFLSKYYKQFP